MTDPSAASGFRETRTHRLLPYGTLAGLGLACFIVVLTAFLSYRSLVVRAETADKVTRTLEVLERLQSLLSNLSDAESGQRGYLLTGDEPYLAPYVSAAAGVANDVEPLRALTSDNPRQQKRIDALAPLVRQKLDELRQTVDLRRAEDAAGALAVVRTDRGHAYMSQIRALIAEMRSEETTLLVGRQAEWETAVRTSFVATLGGAVLLLALILASGWLLARAHRERATESWLRSGLAGLGSQLLGVRRLELIAEKSLSFLARYLDAPVATLYVAEGDGRLRRYAGFADGAAMAPSTAEQIRFGEGLVGQVARENQLLIVERVPPGYAQIRSTLGHGSPRELLIAPASVDGYVHAVLEFGLLRSVELQDRELLARVAQAIGVAIRSSRERERIEQLLAETQQQSQELQAQQEELRVSNEELEEQSRALKASQAQLESQQAELEQTNSQLEEQAQLLENQKDELLQSQDTLSEKASELERSNQYKSEFLANMSHELRTPLNSTLILAKLLADNKPGNLTVEQVKFAETILSAGNDLLTLINDILDLSKIEAGKVDVDVESVAIAGMLDALASTFAEIAKARHLTFSVAIEAGTPERLETDPQRLAQVLRNLLSNAIKFTDRGAVSLRVQGAADGSIAFAVKDSGIGIEQHEQDVIFEAFRQADGSMHRRFGGTGLGLTISRDLARLLGGDIALRSAPGEGSVFTLTLPVEFAGPRASIAPPPAQRASPAIPSPKPRPLLAMPSPAMAASAAAGPAPETDDDRTHLSPNARVILVIEDDKRFAAILKDLAHEMGFECIVTYSASDGLAAAVQFRPSAVLLDMNLPDHSGLGVLDRLKHDSRTRHIPVHVASVGDYRQEARELGAVGYDLKPVKREQLVQALEHLRLRFTQALRRVLVVEDDTRQLASIRQLLENDEVEIVGVTRADEALARLQSTTFDCMVMDLNLPDLSGYELLEKMSAQEDVSFPPVIVYTGRMLTRAEEQRLGRYSRSIIIKDARSPERLLDEVTLFLHQVEADLPPERQRMLREARSREAMLEGRRILIVEDDVRNVFALSSVLDPTGVKTEIARNGREALDVLEKSTDDPARTIDLVLMDIMMPEMDGYTAMRQIRRHAAFKKLPIIALTAKAMRDDQEKCLAAGANDYIAKPLDVEKLLSLVRVWMPK